MARGQSTHKSNEERCSSKVLIKILNGCHLKWEMQNTKYKGTKKNTQKISKKQKQKNNEEAE